MKIYTSCYSKELFQQFTTDLKLYDNLFQQPIILTGNAYIRNRLECFFATEVGACFNWAKKNISYLFELLVDKRAILNEELKEIIFYELINNIDNFSSQTKEYCANDFNQLKTWNFSEKLANVFQQYCYQFPQLIQEWQEKNHKNQEKDFFQAQIFRAILNSAQLVKQEEFIIPTIQNLLGNQISRKQESIFIFLVDKLTPLYAICLDKLAQQHNIFIYQHIVSEDYLGDIQKRSSGENNSLLSLWGKMAKQQFNLFLDLEENQHELIYLNKLKFIANDSLLSHFQEDIIHNKITKIIEKPKTNIEISSYASKREEVEQTFNKILHLIKNEKDIYLDDIVIILPDVEGYRGAIESLFHKNSPRLEYQFFDLFAYEYTHLAKLIDKLIEFYKNDLRQDLFFDIVSNSLVIQAKNWGQDTIKYFFEICQLYQMKNEGDTDFFSWSNGLKHIVNDCFIESQELDLLGIKIQVESMDNLDECYSLIEILLNYRNFFFQSHTMKQWSIAFRKILNNFIFPINNLQESLIFEQLFDKIDCSLLIESKVSLDVFYCYLQDSLKGLKIYNNNRGITLAKFQAIHQISFKYTFILGMDNKNYTSKNESLNLIAEKSSFISTKDNFEYCFLKTISLCTEKLYLSYDFDSNKSANIILCNLEHFIRNNYKKDFCIQRKLSQDIEQSKDCYFNDNLDVVITHNLPKHYNFLKKSLSIRKFVQLLCVPLKLLCSQNFFKTDIFLSGNNLEPKLPTLSSVGKDFSRVIDYAMNNKLDFIETYNKLLDIKERRGLLVKNLIIKDIQKNIKNLQGIDLANRLFLPKSIYFEHFSLELDSNLIIIPQETNSYKIILVASDKTDFFIYATLSLCLFLITQGNGEIIDIEYTFIQNTKTKKFFRTDLSNNYWQEIIQLDISNSSLEPVDYLQRIFELSLNDQSSEKFSQEVLKELEKLCKSFYIKSILIEPYLYNIQKDFLTE